MTTIRYRLLEALKVALPMLPIQIRDGAPWIDYRLVRAEYAAVLAVNALLAPHDLTGREHRVNLREITRRIAPWWTTAGRHSMQALDFGPVAVAIVPLDPDAMFRDACGRVVSWLKSEAASSETAAYLGPEAALECATQASPLVRHLLEIPALRTAFAVLSSGALPSVEAARSARDALHREVYEEWHASSPDAPLAVALVDLLHTSNANEYAWLRLAESVSYQQRTTSESARAAQRAGILAVMVGYEPDLSGQTADRYTKALAALRAFCDGGPLPEAWVSEATAPASELIDEAYRSLRVRAIYYLLIATHPERNAAMVASATECLERLRAEITRDA